MPQLFSWLKEGEGEGESERERERERKELTDGICSGPKLESPLGDRFRV